MINRFIPILFLFCCFGCNHPESKNFDRDTEKTSNKSSLEKSINSITPIDSTQSSNFNEEQITYESPNTINAENIVPLEKQNGVRYLWIEINGIKLKFIFDTGASNICISPAEATVLYRQSTLDKSDILDTEYFQDATGKISEGTKINLRSVKIGNIELKNIEATVIDNVNAPLLLGQSLLEKIGKIEIDNVNNQIILK